MLRYQSKMTDVASITFSLYQLFFLGLSYHQKVPVTKKVVAVKWGLKPHKELLIKDYNDKD